MNMKKEDEETIQELTKEIQHLEHLPKSETGSDTDIVLSRHAYR